MTSIPINFEQAGATDVTGWNNVSVYDTPGTLVADLLDNGTPTGISLVLVSAFTNVGISSALATTEHHGWPRDVWTTFWYSNGAGSLKLTGFEPGQTGTIKLAGHNGAAARDSNYQINGGANNFYDNSAVEPPTAPVSIAFTADGAGEVAITGSIVSTYWYLTGAEVTYTVAVDPSITFTLEDPVDTPYTTAVNVRVRTLAGATVVGPSAVTPNASGVCTLQDAALTAGTEYEVNIYTTDYSRGRILKLTAA